MKHQLSIAILVASIFVSSNASAALATTGNQMLQNIADVKKIGLLGDIAGVSTTTAAASVADVKANVVGHGTTAATTEAGFIEQAINFVKETEKWIAEKYHWAKDEIMAAHGVAEAIKIKDAMQESVEKLSALRTTGESAMAKVLSDAEADHLPDDYTAGLQKVVDGSVPVAGELSTASTFEIITGRIGEAFGMEAGSDNKMKMDDARAAYNRTLSELAYKQAGERRVAIKGYSDVLSSSNPNKDNLDLKDITDLQARILSTQLELVNEQLKLQSLAVIQKSQEQVEQQMLKKQRLSALGLGQGAEGSITSFISQAGAAATVWSIN
jgi:hypothetical protein